MASIVRLDSVQAVYGGAHIYSVQSADVIENGQVGAVGNLLEGEREVRQFVKSADPSKEKAVLVAQDEIIYDESTYAKGDLRNFSIEAGTPFRAYELKEDDVFSVSEDAVTALAADVVVGNDVVLAAGSYKLTEVVPADITTQRFVGRIEAVESIGTSTVVGKPGVLSNVTNFVVIRVVKN